MKYDAIVILSHELTPKRKLNRESILRINKGIEAYLKGISKHIIMNGGPGPFTKRTIEGKYVKRGTHPVQSELMKEYAISKGIPKSNIIIQDYSSDSVGEAFFLKENILNKKKWKNIIIITSKYHIPRVKTIYKKILGSKFNCAFKAVSVPKDKSSKLIKREKKKREFFLDEVKNIKTGDSIRIEKWIYTKHKIYSKINPKNQMRFFTKK